MYSALIVLVCVLALVAAEAPIFSVTNMNAASYELALAYYKNQSVLFSAGAFVAPNIPDTTAAQEINKADGQVIRNITTPTTGMILSVAADSHLNVYTANLSTQVYKWSIDGALLQTFSYGRNEESAWTVRVDSADNLYVLYRTPTWLVVKYDSVNATVLLTVILDFLPWDLVIDADENMYFAAETLDSGRYNVSIRQYSSTGKFIRIVCPLAGHGSAPSLALAPNSDIFVLNQPITPKLLRYSNQGDLLHSYELPLNVTTNMVFDATVPNGAIYILAWPYVADFNGYRDTAIIKVTNVLSDANAQISVQ